jgi:hypothetical protein
MLDMLIPFETHLAEVETTAKKTFIYVTLDVFHSTAFAKSSLVG